MAKLISRKQAKEIKNSGGKLTKAQAGSLGGQRTVKNHGKTYMHNLATRGAREMHKLYKLEKLGASDWLIVHRETGIPTGKTINGLVLPPRVVEAWVNADQ